jgi:hypothetical protein
MSTSIGCETLSASAPPNRSPHQVHGLMGATASSVKPALLTCTRSLPTKVRSPSSWVARRHLSALPFRPGPCPDCQMKLHIGFRRSMAAAGPAVMIRRATVALPGCVNRHVPCRGSPDVPVPTPRIHGHAPAGDLPRTTDKRGVRETSRASPSGCGVRGKWCIWAAPSGVRRGPRPSLACSLAPAHETAATRASVWLTCARKPSSSAR